VTGLTTDLASKATAASIAGATNTKITYNSQGIVTGGSQAQFSDVGGMITPSQVSSGLYGINISGNAATATSANTATTAGSANTANTATNASNLGGVAPANYARLDQGNSFTGNQTVNGNLSLPPVG